MVFPVVAYYLTAEEFGLVANFLVLTQIFAKLVGLNTITALSVDYYKTEKKEEESHLMSNLGYLNFSLFLIVLCGIIIFNKRIELWTGIGLFWQILASLLVLSMVIDQLFTTRLRLQEKAKFFGTYKVLKSVFSGLLTILFVAVFLWSWEGKIYSQVVFGFMAGIIGFALLYRDGLFFHKPDGKAIRGFFFFGLPLLPHNLSYWLKSGFERIFITRSEGLSETGVYAFAANVNAIFVLVSRSFFNAFNPYLFKKLTAIEKEPFNDKKIKKSLVKKTYLFLAFMAVVLFVGYFAGKFLVNLFFQEKFGGSVSLLPYLLAFNFTHAVYGVFSPYIFFTKKTRILGLLTFITGMLQALLTVVLVSKFGTIGAAYATFLVGVITATSVALYSNYVYPMPWLYFLTPNK